MGLRRSPIHWRSALTRSVLVVFAALLAGGAAVLSRLQMPLGWSLGLGAVSAVCATLLLPLVIERIKGLRVGRISTRALKVEADLWCPVGELTDPVRLGVHPALVVTDVAQDVRQPVPQYVSRDIDADVGQAMLSERLVVLLGDSTAGKSRVAFEAMRRDLADHWVLAPRSAESLRRLVDAGCKLRNTVIWLDDLERYLGTNGLDVALLERLVGSPGSGR